ncbi:alpha/beta hydrolase [Streptococcus hillyeri]|uniref:Alpha/beta hydrolase n=1 Tax=Streptococcus hillyeri TaxID=2282420 RepID=A0A3L9DYR4_9STRE|nr:alpha/beta hydrolase [Streptococcus hillyeri]RLY03970.1 alpha/beta hydrolase [Streptococcus hillyeri]
MSNRDDIIALAKQLRDLFQKGDEKRDQGLPTTIPEVQRFDNLQYGFDSKWHLLDIYRPKKQTGKLPVIINIHGGGWVYGTKETYQFYGMSLAKEDFAFVNITYRLAPEVVFPTELDDINLAIHWLSGNAERYQLDLTNVFIVGDSAGGQMALQYIAILTNEKFRNLFKYEKPNLTLRAAAINCGGSFLHLPGAISGATEAYFTDESLAKHGELLRTEEYLTTACPPLFIMTASDDFLRDNSTRLDGYLIAKGIEHEFHIYGTPDNPKHHVFHCNIRDEMANQCNQDELNFFRRYLVKTE